MSEQQAFHDAMARDPNDATTRLVYADWLDEHDMPEEAKKVRTWGNLLPHVNDFKRPHKTPTGSSGLPTWLRQLVIQHYWRNQPMSWQAGGHTASLASDERDAYARVYPNDELHAYGLPNDDRGTENLNRVRDVVGSQDITHSEGARERLHHIAGVIKRGAVKLARTKVPAGGAIVGGGTQTGGTFQRGGQFAARARKRIRDTVLAWLRNRITLARKKAGEVNLSPGSDVPAESLRRGVEFEPKPSTVAGSPGSVAEGVDKTLAWPRHFESHVWDSLTSTRLPFTKRQLREFEEALELPSHLRMSTTKRFRSLHDDDTITTSKEKKFKGLSQVEAAKWMDKISRHRMNKVMTKTFRDKLRDPNMSSEAKIAYMVDHLTHELGSAKAAFADTGGAQRWYGDMVAVMARHLHDSFHDGSEHADRLWGTVDPQTGRIKHGKNGEQPAGVTLAKLLVAATSGGQKPDANYRVAHKMMEAGKARAGSDPDLFAYIPAAQHDDHDSWVKKALAEHNKLNTGVTEEEIRNPGHSLTERTAWHNRVVFPLSNELGGGSYSNNSKGRYSGMGVTYVHDPGGEHHLTPVAIEKDGENYSPYGGHTNNVELGHPDRLVAPDGHSNYMGRLFATYGGTKKLRHGKIPAFHHEGKLKAPGWGTRPTQVREDLDIIRGVMAYFKAKHHDSARAMEESAHFFLNPQSEATFDHMTEWMQKHIPAPPPEEDRRPIHEAVKSALKENRGFFFHGEELPGAFLLGPKFGAFANNLHLDVADGPDGDAARRKHGQYITADMWWSRTWNRFLGSLIGSDGKSVDTPRNDTERKVMLKSAEIAAKRAGLNNVAELQAVLWYYEQQMYRWLGVKADSKSYEDGVNSVANPRGLRYTSDKLTGKVDIHAEQPKAANGKSREPEEAIGAGG